MPIPRVSPTGVTAMDPIAEAVTVSVVFCLTPANLAEIIVVPVASELASPFEVMLAIDVVEEPHATTLVRSELLPSL